MGKVKRPEFINTARMIGRRDAIKKRCDHMFNVMTYLLTGHFTRDMVAGSKRRKEKNKQTQEQEQQENE